MTLPRNISFLFVLATAALVCGALVAFGVFYIVGYFEMNRDFSTPGAVIVEKNMTAKLPFNVNNIGDNAERRYSILFVGDIMMDRGIRSTVEKYGKGDYSYPFERVRDALSEADIAFGNLEGPISDQGEKHGSLYSFRMDPAVIRALYDAGIDAVSVANNHMGDYGREALEDTMRRLRRAGIAYAGAGWDSKEAQDVTIVERAGQKIGFLGFSDVGPAWIEAGEAVPGISLASVGKVTKAVRQARGKVDILVVSYHFGEEYEVRSRARQQELAHAAVDAGTNIVIGHHPHVVQEVEQYKGGVIAYSLGNFIFDQAFSDDTKKALALKLFMKGKTIERFEKIPVVFNERFQPEFKPR